VLSARFSVGLGWHPRPSYFLYVKFSAPPNGLNDDKFLQDEIDALATSRSSGNGEGTLGSSEGVLTMLLNEMDGVQELVGVTVVAATNRPDAIASPVTCGLSPLCNAHGYLGVSRIPP
jgi:hypothetical protein